MKIFVSSVILGGEYGAKQPSALSATHEEYREARETRPTFVFVQDGVTRKGEHYTTGSLREPPRLLTKANC